MPSSHAACTARTRPPRSRPCRTRFRTWTRIDMHATIGQYWDQETQTHYNFNRDYLPGLGRYVQGDPIGLDGGLNIFAYVKLNPLVDFDPRGLKPAGDPEPGIIDWAKDHACSKGCDWVYKKCRETWMRYCVSFGRSTVCAELCEFQVPEICQREKEKRCPDPVSCNGSEGGSLG